MASSIRYEIDQNQIAILTLDRPAVRNALNWKMMEGFAHRIDTISKEDVAQVLIVTGEGGAFCAGGDLFELHHYSSQADGERLAMLMGDALATLAALSIPVIAAIEGPAIGGGAEITLACDLRVSSTNAKIGFPQINLALTPAWGGAGHLVKLLGHSKAFALLSSGEIMDSKTASDMGLINCIVPDGQALAAAGEIALELVTKHPASVQALKRILRAHSTLPLTEATTIERSVFAELWAAEAHRLEAANFIDRKGS
jgi:enoyl-CoA hydratase